MLKPAGGRDFPGFDILSDVKETQLAGLPTLLTPTASPVN